MSDSEKLILETVAEIIPELSEPEKMYLLGQAEGMALMKKREKKEAKEESKDEGK